MKPSKSKLALAKVINENGEWPQDSEWAVQNGDHGRISFSINKPVRHDSKSWMAKGGFNFKIEVCKPLKNWHQCVLSREEYYQAYPKADADGWIEWNGGERPVSGDDIVDVAYSTYGAKSFSAAANSLRWSKRGLGGDIIAYRLHKPEVKPEFCESVMMSIPEPEEKPTIEQLAADYRNAKDYADRKQDEADKASMESDAALSQLEDAIAAIGFVITPLAATEKEPELVITHWRDLRVGDEIEMLGDGWNCDNVGKIGVVRIVEDDGYFGDLAILCDIGEEGSDWGLGFKFIRRP